MNLLSAENISKSYSERQLFNDISLGINEGDKIGVIGINGTGKTTLLKIIGGFEEADGGRVIMGNSVRIEYLHQNPHFDPEVTVLEHIRLTHNIDAMNAWSIESEAKAVLTRLGISDFDAKIGTLSGGQRKRIALAASITRPSDLLILDEPTNHLDNDTIDWLEQYLNKRKGALLMVTHDRYFLDRVTSRIIELDGGKLYEYEGNYSSFLEKKLIREENEAASEKKRQNLYRKELAWIKRGAKARSTKQKARIERFEKLSEQVSDIADEKLEISVAGSRLGKKVIELENICKSFEGKKIIDGFNYIVLRNDRVGIIGPNGSGKTTLLNIISGKLSPDGGKVERGETVKVGFYCQENSHMDDSLRVIEYIKEGAEVLTTAEGYKLSASQMLERFLFPAAMQWAPISKLSGGEKRRLYLLRVLMESPNVLLLDEPTNDLDIETLKILEDYIDSFKGAVIAVSHDRYFLDRIADRIFSFEGDGSIVEYTGNYSDYKEKHDNRKEVKQNAQKNSSKANNSSSGKSKDKSLRFSFKEQKEYEEIDDVVSGLEDRLKQIERGIDESSADYTKLLKLTREKQEVENQLAEKMERWVYLNELAEKIAQNH